MATLCALGVAQHAQATGVSVTDNHGDVLLYANTGTIETGYYDYDLEQVVEGTRLFVRRMGVIGSDFFGTTNPGFTTFNDLNNQVAYTLPASADLTFDVPAIPGSDAVSRNLLYWDGEGSADFGAAMPGDSFLLRRSSSLNTTLDGSTSPAGGFSIQTTNPDGEMHNHISFSARGSGGSQPADGFYLFAMQLAAGGIDAEPVYFLFNAEYERGGGGQVLYNGDVPITDTTAEQLAIDWVLDNLLTVAIPGDTDGDGDIDDSDLGTAFSNYTGPLAPGTGTKTAADGDTDGDGDVDDSDLGTAFSGYTGPLGPTPSVPEPASAVALLFASALLHRRRPNLSA
ncbi:MAG: hypothetical protein ACE37H_04450 [Phycisphaeraceae bacterium]